MAWAVPNGPLTIENPEGTIHLALFETESDSKSISAVAFGASGEEFLVWKDKLENHGLELRITDHIWRTRCTSVIHGRIFLRLRPMSTTLFVSKGRIRIFA